jgi:monoamine oxidase
MMPKAFRAMALLVISCDLVATVKVIVVGAGTSGLAAARTLIDTWDATANGGPLELTVLEAGTRIGGRVWTLNADEAGAAWTTAGALGAPTDMGASWIHGSNLSHPITKIATALGLAEGAGLVRTRNSLAELQLCSGQTSSCPSVSDDKYTVYQSLIAQAQRGAEAANSDKSLWEALSGLSESDQSRSSDLFQFHLASSAEFNTAGPASELSALFYNDDSKYKGSELVWAQGYKTMYEALQSGAVRVTDGSSPLQVTAVEAGSRNPISVTYNKRVRDVSYNSAEVVLTTEDNAVYRADYAIITVPLGVLKSSDASSQVTFSPALPPATANGIAQLGFGNVVKVALLFPSAWWPTGAHYYGLAQAGEPDRGLFTYYLNVHALSTKPVLMTFALGGAADVAEGMTNAEMWTKVCSPLPLAGATSAKPLTISRASPPHLSRRSGRIWSRSCRVMSRSRRLLLRSCARIGAPILLQRARTRLSKSVRRQSHLRRRAGTCLAVLPTLP